MTAPAHLSPLGNDRFLVRDDATNAVLGKIVKKDRLPPAVHGDYWEIHIATSAGSFYYIGYNEFDKCAEIVYKWAKYRGLVA